MPEIEFTYDASKNQANIAKHGIALGASNAFEWHDALLRQDDRAEYGEVRFRAIGYIGDRLHVVIFTDRDVRRRIISLRKANRREERLYAEA